MRRYVVCALGAHRKHVHGGESATGTTQNTGVVTSLSHHSSFAIAALY